MAQTPLFKACFLGVCSVLALWSGTTLLGGPALPGLSVRWNGPSLHAESAPDSAEGFLALADSTSEANQPKDVPQATKTSPAEEEDAEPSPEKAAQKINAKLDRPMTADFVETPVSEALAFLKDLSQVPMYIDRDSIDEHGVALDAKFVTMNVKGVSLRSTLKLVLEPLRLRALVKDEVLMITSERRADDEVVTRPYRVADLMADDATMEELTEAVRSTVSPAKWNSESNPEVRGQIKSVGKTLVVTQTEEVHERIAKLLEDLRQP